MKQQLHFCPKPRQTTARLNGFLDDFSMRIAPKLEGHWYTELDLSPKYLRAGSNFRFPLKTLIESGALGSIHSLVLDDCENLFDSDIELLAGSHLSMSLRSLSFDNLFIGNEAARALATSPWLSKLEELRLMSTDLNDDGVATLFSSQSLPRLSSLVIDDILFSPEGAEAVMATRGLPSLRHLSYSKEDWDEKTIQRFEEWLRSRGIQGDGDLY